MATTNEQVTALIVQELGLDREEVTPDARFAEDLGADSLDRIEMMMRAEETFDILISDTEAQRVTTVREMVSLVDVKLAERAART